MSIPSTRCEFQLDPAPLANSPRLIFSRARLVVLFLVCLGAALWLDRPIHDFVHLHYNVHTRPVPDSLKLATRILRSMEDWGENIFIAGIAFAICRLDIRHRSRFFCLILSAVVVAGSVEVIKRLSGRERPEVSGGRVVFHGPARWREGGDLQSFPSGHTAAAASYSGSLAAFYPPLRPVVIAFAVGCGASRIWKERHFLSDCLAGGVLGFWIASTLPRRRWLQPYFESLDRRLSASAD